MRIIPKLGATALALTIECAAVRAQTPIPPSPQDFVLAVAQSDQYEILAARLAEVQALDQRVRVFAQKMLQDHMRLSEDMRQAAAASGLPLSPRAMSSDQAMLLSGLQGLRGADFDSSYLRQQELAHAQAVAVEGSFASSGADANLRGAARSALPTIKDHLDMAKQLSAALGR